MILEHNTPAWFTTVDEIADRVRARLYAQALAQELPDVVHVELADASNDYLVKLLDDVQALS